MKKYLRYLILVLSLLSVSIAVPAVEKSPKKTPSAQPSKSPAPVVKDSQKSKPKEQPAPPKKYDDFVDKNKNGVDDRKENLKKTDSK
ncbi:hypothetical protein C3F09_00185 [candidate division GN15 bacterium]|uniref:EF-hand domain-containing protein n=1 Tax=candidate division GN15 bacterium TaxID=2072418 RepID=A0A855X5J0_9BACT|nr:MAG: hypothetical protein C3F09_00185 [candidate division GN15 bacterium]